MISGESVAFAAISGIAGNTSARTGDPESGIGKIFDQEAVQKEIDAQVRITQVFGQLAPKAAADFAGKQAEELRKQGNVEEARKWEEGGVYRIALHTALGGLAGGTSGALGAGASAAAAPLLNELQSSIVEQLKSAGASDTVAKLTGQLISGATAAGIGAAAGGAQGATTAFNTDANNRQLHPEEKDLAKELAKKSKGKFTEEEIADALRWASNVDLNETASSNIVVQLTPSTQAGEIFDAQSMSLDASGGQAVLYQDLSRITPPAGELMAFIQQNTGDTYSWNTAAWQAVPQATFSQNGTRYGVFSANGQSFQLPLAECPAGGCTTSPIAWANTSPQDQAALQAYATAAGVEMTSFVSRTAGIVGSTATTAAATPGPHQPVAAGTAIVAQTIGLAADAVESYITRDSAKMVETAFYMAIQGRTDKVLPLAAPITNEVIEAWKTSGSRRELGEWVNQYWQEFRAKWSQK